MLAVDVPRASARIQSYCQPSRGTERSMTGRAHMLARARDCPPLLLGPLHPLHASLRSKNKLNRPNCVAQCLYGEWLAVDAHSLPSAGPPRLAADANVRVS
eukprot:363084-Chlamydomonas_euryale.AAC.4